MPYQQAGTAPGRRPAGPREPSPAPAPPTFKLSDTDPALYNDQARAEADKLDSSGRRDKSAQLRRFYEELCMWDDKVRREPAAFRRVLPLVQMMNAKVAYAAGRSPALVSEAFQNFFAHGLRQVDAPSRLHQFKLLFEAVIGFRKPKSRED